jgi:hypothetical protein
MEDYIRIFVGISELAEDNLLLFCISPNDVDSDRSPLG